jgi:hypothetical protein
MKLTDKINVSQKRLENESLQDYRERLKLAKKAIKRYLSGFVVWQPNYVVNQHGQVAGPYIKELHGPISLNHNLNIFIDNLNSDENSDSKEKE